MQHSYTLDGEGTVTLTMSIEEFDNLRQLVTLGYLRHDVAAFGPMADIEAELSDIAIHQLNLDPFDPGFAAPSDVIANKAAVRFK